MSVIPALSMTNARFVKNPLCQPSEPISLVTRLEGFHKPSLSTTGFLEIHPALWYQECSFSWPRYGRRIAL